MTTDFIAADWPAPSNVIAGTSLRSGGVSKGAYASLNLGAHVGDDARAVAENRARLRRVVRLDAEPAWLNQVHGTSVVQAPLTEAEPEADACWTSAGNTACAVLTADCLPVLLTTRDSLRLAAAHAGWRGLAGGVIEAVIEAMKVEPRDLLAWLGPAISQPAFEVGDEVRAAFLALDPASAACFEANARGRWQADLYGLARRRLALAGVSEVYGGGRCTSLEAQAFFSYRRDGITGRMASLIYRSDA